MIQPEVKPYDIVYIGSIKCIVRRVYEEGSPSGVGEVVFDQGKPTSHDFDWRDGEWVLPERPDYGGYVNESDTFLNRLRRHET